MAAGTKLASLDFLPENLHSSLLDFQRHGIRFAIKNQGRCLIGDEMGLGKTLQAISIAYYYKDEWPLLIVVPSSMKYPWIEEIEKWVTDLEPWDINLIRSGVDVSNIATSKINILGYGLCGDRRSSQLLVNALKDQAFKIIILDESHYIKNRLTGRTKLLHPISKAAKRVILLTGTPSLARPEELYVQLDIVRPGVFGSFSTFATRYCEAHYEYLGKFRKWNTRGACRLDELHKRLSDGIMIRRLKKNVLTQLPPKRRQKITFDVPESGDKQKYSVHTFAHFIRISWQDLLQAKTEFKEYHRTLGNKEATKHQKSEALFELNRLSTVLYHYTGLAKAGPIQQYISDLLDGMDNKFLVFCRHRQVITAVVQQMVKKQVKYIKIDGSVPSQIRGNLVNQFQNNPAIRVAVLSIEAASFGLTLTAADHVVFAELHHTPGVMMQAEDRAHRIGQVNAVNVHYLVGRGTLDEVLWAMLKRKIYVTSSALDGKLAELQAVDGDESTSKHLSACAAWLRDESEDNDDDIQDYLFTQKKRSHKQIEGQQDVRTFFTPTTNNKVSSSQPCTNSPLISIDDSSEDDTDHDVFNEDELAEMLVEDNVHVNSHKNIPRENEEEVNEVSLISSSSTKTCNEETRNETSSATVTPSVTGLSPKFTSIPSHLYEHSEAPDSEDIFNSYITTDGYDDDDNAGDDNGDDDNGSDNVNDDKTEWTNNCADTSSTSVNAEIGRDEHASNSAQSSDKAKPRNPFATSKQNVRRTVEENASKYQEILSSDSDSDDDFVDRMPKNIPILKREVCEKTESSTVDNLLTASDNQACIEVKEERTMSRERNEQKSETVTATNNWSCNFCTFLNDPQMTECSICLNRRNRKKIILPSSVTASNGVVKRDQNRACLETLLKEKKYVEDPTCISACEDDDTSSEYFSGSSTCTTNSTQPRRRNDIQDSPGRSCVLNTPKQFKVNKEGTGNSENSLHDDKDSNDFRSPLTDWSCSKCTLLNDPMMNECSVCFTPRRRSQRNTNSQWSTSSYEKRRQEKKSKTSRREKGPSSERRRIPTKREEEDEVIFEVLGDKSVNDVKNDNSSAAESLSIPCVAIEDTEVKSMSHPQTRKRLNLEESRKITSSDVEDNSTFSVEKTITSNSVDMETDELKTYETELQMDESQLDGNQLTGSQLTESQLTGGQLAGSQSGGSHLAGSQLAESVVELKHSDTGDTPMSFILELSDSDETDDNLDFEKETPMCGLACDETTKNRSSGQNIFSNSQELGHSLDMLEQNLDVDVDTCDAKTSGTESLHELQEAAELLFGEEDDLLEDFNALDRVEGVSSTGFQKTDTNSSPLDSALTCVEPSASISINAELPDELEDSQELIAVVKKPKDPPQPMTLWFAMSLYTDRVFLYDEDEQHLQCNFLMSDVKTNSREDLPHILQHDHNYKQAKRMLQEWNRLGVNQKRVVSKSKLVFRSPLDAYWKGREMRSEELTNVRHVSKELRRQKVLDTAAEVGGDVRLVTRSPGNRKRKRKGTSESSSPSTSRSPSKGTTDSNSEEISCMQAFGPEGSPLCLYCKAPVDYGAMGNDWDSRFCSHDCKQNYQIRISGTAVRRTLFVAEQGVCQLCQFDAHAYFNSVKALPKKDRRAFLDTSVYAGLSSQALNRMIVEPKEGMFWEADHIVAVTEGGGECGMENFRTLCVPCHKSVTRDLLKRLRTAKRQKCDAGSRGIAAFLKPKSCALD